MNRVFFIFLLTFSFLQSESYSWEDGGTILGYYGNISNPTNSGSLNGVNPYDGDSMLSVSESPISGTPKAYLAYIQDLNPGDVVTASFYTYDSASGSPSARIWGSYASNTDINSYAGSAGGNDSYPEGTGWEQLSHSWTIADDKEALVIEARLYSGSDDPTVFYFDLISVSAPETATINFPGDLGDLIQGCTDPDACNYDSEANSNDGSCLYNDCLGECGGTAEIDACGVCQGDGSTCDSAFLFFSEYAEGSSNNKYIEIYNPGSELVDLSGYAFPSVGNDPTTPGDYEYWNSFDAGASVAPGDVYVICHSSADDTIQSECDQQFTYLSNGNDGMCLVFGTESSYQILDCLGDWNGNPGTAWDVAGVSGATADHTLVRKASIETGTSNWPLSAGTNTEDSQWTVLDIDTWTYLGSHPHDFTVLGCTDPYASNYNPDANVDDGTCDYSAPVANAGSDQSVDFGATVTLSGNGYVSDGQIIGYLWSQTGGPSVTLSDYEEQTVTFTAPDEFCTLTFSLQVIDSNANFSSLDEVSVFVGSYSIYDIQYTEEQGAYCYETDAAGEEVTVSGVVTHVKPGDYPNFFIQDPDDTLWSGIYVYDTSINPSVGDEITLTASVNEYYSLTQLIDVTYSAVSSSGNNIEPLAINAADLGIQCSLSGEQYESMLVTIQDVSFDSVDEYGNWTVSDASGNTMIDDYYYDGNFPSVSPGDNYDCVTGVVSYSYSEFKIYPRNISDFSCYELSCVADGDINEDNSADVLDVVIIVSSIIEGSNLTEEQSCAADINEDGSVDVLDIVGLVQLILS